MVLSFIFLQVRFKLINIVGVLLSLIGISSLVLTDANNHNPCSTAKGNIVFLLVYIPDQIYKAYSRHKQLTQ